MRDVADRRLAKYFKSNRNKGIAVFSLCVLACKIPVLVVLLGFGGLGARASVFNFSPIVQFIGLGFMMFSIALGVIFLGYRAYRRVNS